MGSTQSTSDENYNSSNATANNNNNNITNNNIIVDHWWPIENNDNFTLEQPNLNEIINELSDFNNRNIITNNNNNNNSNNSNSNILIEKEKEDNSDLLIINNKNISDTNFLIENKNIKKNSILIPSTSSSLLNDVIEDDNDNKLLKNHNYSSPIINNKIKQKEQTLEEFKEELKAKRMERQTAITDLRNELSRLRCQLAEEREINRKLKNGELNITSTTTTTTTTNNDNKKILIDACVSTNDNDHLNIDNNNDDIITNDNPNNSNNDPIIAENTQFEISLKEMVKQLQKDLAETHYNLQMTNSENLTLNSEVGVLRKQVTSLKDVITCSKQMIDVREEQVTQLKAKLTQIEESLADRETKLLSEDLRREYDKQMENIRNLRQLYEERARVCAAERENLLRQIQIKKDELASETEKTKNLEERIDTLEKDVQDKQKIIEEKNSEYGSLKYENRELKEEMNAINLLFSQMLMGFNGNNCLDIDRLTVMLEENRTLLNEMATKEANYEGASLPKLLFDIVKQVNDNDDTVDNSLNIVSTVECPTTLLNDVQNKNNSITCKDNENTLLQEVAGTASLDVKQEENLSKSKLLSEAVKSESLQMGLLKGTTTSDINSLDSKESSNSINESKEKDINPNSLEVEQENACLEEKNNADRVVSAQEIIGNLPKVWRVIMELLNHQKIEKVDFVENGQNEECYKLIQTPNGTKSELSVSKTYIKLKNLILEKKSLVKETNRLKTLNSHLEYRLNEQEKRLSAVSLELQKTWHLVSKMQRQHRQLHTHEQILRYQLQQKRRLLNELKEELEYCRRKWAAARAKNMESQIQCDDMRKEFAKRRLEDSNNSAESGYSDGAGSGTDEDEKDFEQNKNNKIPPHKFVHDFIENSRILERRNSLSPIRTIADTNLTRWQSSPAVDTPVSFLTEQITNNDDFDNAIESQTATEINVESVSTGAIPKQIASGSGTTQSTANDSSEPDRTERIQRLENQCKSLIARVLETSDCREKLELQIKRFQDEMPPVQHPVPLNEFIQNNKRKKSPSPETSTSTQEVNTNKGVLTEREEEYTRRRTERIQRLESESKQLISSIRKANDRGSTMIIKLRELHARRTGSREGSTDRSTDESDKNSTASGTATASEKLNESIDQFKSRSESMLGRCAERLRRLEEEGQMLLSKWTKNSERGTELENKLDSIHSRYANKTNSSDTKRNENDENGGASATTSSAKSSRPESPKTVEERLKEVQDKANSRNERIKQMEIESAELITKLTKTSNRGSSMINRLSENRERRNSLKKEQEKLKMDRKSASIDDDSDIVVKGNQTDSKQSTDTNNEKEEASATNISSRSTGAKPKVKTLPKTGVAAVTLSAHSRSKEQKSVEKQNKSGDTESLEEMFMRLSGLSTPGNSSKTEQVNEQKTDKSDDDQSPPDDKKE
ncbi:repetitive organellar protein [Condylostylus longicornis]|uniref:repetitive organellar protein n=1 Tax=Condylostylus longicornis TaxID=2530218 RepID=UPI00244E595C|nr:repetitive organellar protein [Condylostylus longicornis]